MTFLSPAAFFLLFAALLIVMLHLLRARERRRTVSALFLWEGLTGDPQSRAARIRQQFDPLLLLQLAALFSIVIALAQPAWQMRTASVSGLAIVLDGSASMQTLTPDGSTRYQSALEEANLLLDRYPSSTTAVLQLSAQPEILARPGLSDPELREAFLSSAPTWYGDGTVESLHSLLGSLGGTSRFQKVVILSDHPWPDVPDSFDMIHVGGGDNLGLIGFSVRENPTSSGVTAFVTALNGTDTYQDVTIKIDDRENQTTLSLLMPPGSIEQYVIPFPSSRGTLFTALLEQEDDYMPDNRRYFSLDRPIDVRVHWLGTENRYIMAALRSISPVVLVDDPGDADLTVVYNTTAPASQSGTALLIHGGIESLLSPGENVAVSQIEVASPDHPLLDGIDPAGFLIREAPAIALPPASRVVLTSGDVPLLATYVAENRSVFYLAPDIMETNLPITIDFPILMRNIVSTLVRLPSKLSYSAAEVGDPVSLTGRGAIAGLYDASDRAISLPAGLTAIRPVTPGFHTLLTDRGAFAIAVNVPMQESALPSSESEVDGIEATAGRALRYLQLWPTAAAFAILLLVVEAHWRYERRGTVRRTR